MYRQKSEKALLGAIAPLPPPPPPPRLRNAMKPASQKRDVEEKKLAIIRKKQNMSLSPSSIKASYPPYEAGQYRT